jgi:hypothetical protein
VGSNAAAGMVAAAPITLSKNERRPMNRLVDMA